MRRVVSSLILAAVLLVSCSLEIARADLATDTTDGEVTASAQSETTHRRGTPTRARERSSAKRGSSSAPKERRFSRPKEARPGSAEAAEEYGRKVEAAVARYESELRSQDVCRRTVDVERCGVAVRPTFDPQEVPVIMGRSIDDPEAPTQVRLAPRQVAYIAFARLKLTAPTPGIGPSPSVNKWDMAAVGYPLWLWGEGRMDPGPVSDSVGGLFVSLDAKVSKIEFTMGDGTTVTCPGAGKRWGSWVTPGAKSPSCGHVYTKPSLPKGDYTVTATTTWSVSWNVTGQTGVIPFVQSASTTLPVGELQALVR